MMTRIPVTLLASLLLIATATGIALSRSPFVLSSSNAVAETEDLTNFYGRGELCQGQETVPAQTSAVRLALDMDVGSGLTVTVLQAGRPLAEGHLAAGWKGADVTVPLKALEHAVSPVTVCTALGASNEPTGLIGARSSGVGAATLDGARLPGRIAIEYLHRDRRPWWSLASSVVRRMGLGRAWGGSWVVLPVVVLMLAVIALSCTLLLRRLR